MASKKTITYFLEDSAQEQFIVALTERLARQEGISIRNDQRSAMYGGRPLFELRRFLATETRRGVTSTDLLIVAMDGNCKGTQQRYSVITQAMAAVNYPRPYVCAIPDPHIERWYLCDPQAVRAALSASVSPVLPPYKCAKDHYKRLLSRTVIQAGLTPVIGGAEHGATIVEQMDLYHACSAEASLNRFVEDARIALRQL